MGDAVQNLTGIEIADDDKNRVIGLIIFAVVSLLLLDRSALHILQPSDNGISIRMDFESRGLHVLQKKAPGRIESRLQLFNDNLLLRLKFILLKGTVHHSIGFDLQSDVPAIRSKIEVVRGKIV